MPGSAWQNIQTLGTYASNLQSFFGFSKIAIINWSKAIIIYNNQQLLPSKS